MRNGCSIGWCRFSFGTRGLQGGKIDANPRVPVTFNTGQILIGLAAGVRRFGPEYRVPMIRAAKWLVESQDADGCWRKHPTPFAAPGEKSYETHVAWGLFEAAKLEPTSDFGDAGLRQVRWALTKQLSNGWFASNCLETPDAPLTHTIGYALRGVIRPFASPMTKRFSIPHVLRQMHCSMSLILRVVCRDNWTSTGGQLCAGLASQETSRSLPVGSCCTRSRTKALT